MRDGCVFCDYEGPNPVLVDRGSVFVIKPINPVCEGHALVIPRDHVPDAFADPWLTGKCFEVAAELAEQRFDSCNLITSVGTDATQSVFHLHVHVVPRREGDGLLLPWSLQDPGLPPKEARELARNWFLQARQQTAETLQELRKLIR